MATIRAALTWSILAAWRHRRELRSRRRPQAPEQRERSPAGSLARLASERPPVASRREPAERPYSVVPTTATPEQASQPRKPPHGSLEKEKCSYFCPMVNQIVSCASVHSYLLRDADVEPPTRAELRRKHRGHPIRP